MISRYKNLIFVLVISSFCAFFLVSIVNAQQDDSFTLAILPDTQSYVASDAYVPIFNAQITWIKNNYVSQKIAFVLHEGDMTDTNNILEWNRFTPVMRQLDNVVPYALTTGNHDSDYNWTTFVADYTNFHANFPVSNIAATNANFRGTYEPDKLENAYYTFEAAGRKWGIVTLEYAPGDDVLAWANQIVSQLSDHLFIVLTHSYMYHDGNPTNPYPPDNPVIYNTRFNQIEGVSYQWSQVKGSGEHIWQTLVRKHRNIFAVLSGHTLGTGTGRRVDTGDNGNQVFQILANYQMYNNGFMRLMTISPAQKKISIKTYAPHNNTYNTTEYNQFEFTNINSFDITKTADANGDNKVDGIDYVAWLNHYGQNASGAPNGDFDNNGIVDGVDYVIWLNNYGK